MQEKLELKSENGVLTVDSMVQVMKRMSITGAKNFEQMQAENRKDLCNSTLEDVLKSTKKLGMVEWNQSMYYYIQKRNMEVFNEQYKMMEKFKLSVPASKKLTKEETAAFLKSYKFGLDNFGVNFGNAVRMFRNLDVAQMMIDFKVLDTTFLELGFEYEDLIAALEEFKDEKDLIEQKQVIDKYLVDMKVLPKEMRKCNHDHSHEGGPNNSQHQHGHSCGHDHSHDGHDHGHSHEHDHHHEESKTEEHDHSKCGHDHSHDHEQKVEKKEEKVETVEVVNSAGEKIEKVEEKSEVLSTAGTEVSQNESETKTVEEKKTE